MSEPQATGLLGPASLDALLAGLIDYAGLFPPAGLDMQSAVANYARYLAGPYARALGRFVLPVSRFAEFEQAFAHIQPIEPWGISALVSANCEADLAAIDKFNERNTQSAHVDVVEVKANTPDEIAHIRAFVRGTITPYFEISSTNPGELLSTIHHIRGRAKIRTGGLTPDAIPTSEAVARFLIECATHGVAFKATAGLHHPIRCTKPLTYESEAQTGVMHGFLNVFLSAVVCHVRPVRPERIAVIVPLLDAQSPDLKFEDNFASICAFANPSSSSSDRGKVMPAGARIPIQHIRSTRQNFAISFGSCSFEEPIEDLKALNLL